MAHWLTRYPPHPVAEASYADGTWTVNVFSGKAGEIATGSVDDASGAVTEAWTGPQAAWKMARGYPGAFGGVKLNSYKVWLSFCAIFLLGLVDWRRPFSLRNLDLLVLVSLSVSLELFNRGHIFAAMSAAYPPLVWLLVRCFWIGRRDRPLARAPVWPVWVLIAATVFLAGFRVGLNVRTSDVIDVGYSGVIGADRIWHGQSPTGTSRSRATGRSAGRPTRRVRCATGSRRTAAARARTRSGDTYGPVSYIAYLPGYWFFGWSGKWDRCRRCTSRRCSSTGWRCSGSASSGAGSAGRDSGRRSRSRGLRGRSPSTRPTRTRTTRSCPPS